MLLVDDSLDGRRAMARLLELYGFEVVAAGTGAEALAAMRSLAPFDVVLTDLLLPDIDGHEVARQARRLDPSPTIVMFTGWDFGDDLREHPGDDVDLVLLKPLNIAELVAKVNALRPADA